MIKTLVKTSPNVFATMGGDGVIFCKDGKVISQETYPTHCKNSTGAGDTFNGAFAAALMRDEDYEDALLYGLYVSAIKVQEEGAQNGVLSLEETEERMGEIERPPFVEIDEDEKVLEEVVENETTLVISIDDNDGDAPRVD